MTIPNLLLGGAPKCGTSTVFDWLCAQPDVSGTKPKETFYLFGAAHPLASDTGWDAHGLAGYGRLGTRPTRWRVDGTTHYLFHDEIAERAAALPDCRAVFVLRHPSRRFRSSFEYSRDNLARVRGLTFPNFVRGALAGSAVQGVDHPVSRYVLDRDLNHGDYAVHLERWFEALGRDRVNVLIFEEVVADPQAALQPIADELGLTPQDWSLPKKNRTVAPKSARLHRLARTVAEALPASGLRRRAGDLYRRLALAGAPQARNAADEAAMAQLDRHYGPRIEALETLLGRPIEAWHGSGR